MVRKNSSDLHSTSSPKVLFLFFLLSQIDSTLLAPPPLSLLPLSLQAMKQQFEQAYHHHYERRVLYWQFQSSTYTVDWSFPSSSSSSSSSITLILTYEQMMVLHRFDHQDALTLAQLVEETGLDLSTVMNVVHQLTEKSIHILQVDDGVHGIHGESMNDGPSLPSLSSSTIIRVAEGPSSSSTETSSSVLNLVPPLLLSLHQPSSQAVAEQDMTVMHQVKVDAAIVRIMKTAKFSTYEDLFANLMTMLDFVPEVGIMMILNDDDDKIGILCQETH